MTNATKTISLLLSLTTGCFATERTVSLYDINNDNIRGYIGAPRLISGAAPLTSQDTITGYLHRMPSTSQQMVPTNTPITFPRIPPRTLTSAPEGRFLDDDFMLPPSSVPFNHNDPRPVITKLWTTEQYINHYESRGFEIFDSSPTYLVVKRNEDKHPFIVRTRTSTYPGEARNSNFTSSKTIVLDQNAQGEVVKFRIQN